MDAARDRANFGRTNKHVISVVRYDPQMDQLHRQSQKLGFGRREVPPKVYEMII